MIAHHSVWPLLLVHSTLKTIVLTTDTYTLTTYNWHPQVQHICVALVGVSCKYSAVPFYDTVNFMKILYKATHSLPNGLLVHSNSDLYSAAFMLIHGIDVGSTLLY